MHYAPEALHAFVEAATLGSFSAAARKLGKSQSTVSESIANLEIDLCVTLFDRQQRPPALTDAGRQLLPRAEDILAAHDRLSRNAGQLLDGMEARLTLVVSDTALQSIPYETLLAELDARYPDLELECMVAEHDDVIDLVEQGRAQLGLVGALPDYPADIGRATLATPAEISLYVGRAHPLAGRADLDRDDLLGVRELRLNTVLDKSQRPTGGRCWSAPNYLLLMEMAAFGFGGTELPDWLAEHFGRDDLVKLKMAGWPKYLAVDVVWSRRHRLGPAGGWLLETLSRS
ncbi:LysR family transcriptional regulator [Crenobacter cavernae]|uniref:LysR family transcriptional regulator n=1 Tax=Crenobacter cavernae TaxID=2290923 RepID=A0ABY0FF76_9NEIS|nr:LysR family transcriptional regulator [Crenobacter cavernae]RXZ44947.1 LysR family transcriptional regulator [Crenobacter cavernae]